MVVVGEGRESTRGNFPEGGMWKFLASGRLLQQGKGCRLLCYSAISSCNIGEFTFDTRNLANRGTTQTRKPSN